MAFRFAPNLRTFTGLLLAAAIGVGVAADGASAQQTGPSPGSAKANFRHGDPADAGAAEVHRLLCQGMPVRGGGPADGWADLAGDAAFAQSPLGTARR